MPIPILMPALSPTMTEGKLARWLKAEGDKVAAGEVLAEIETDKATMEVEAVDEGSLGRILVAAGSENVAVNTPIALLLEEGEDASALDKPAAAAPAALAAASPAPASVAAATAAPAAAPGPASAQAKAGGRLFASPLARRLAAAAGLDLALVPGSGPHGRVIKRDVEQAVARGVGKPAATAAPTPAAAAPVAPKPAVAEAAVVAAGPHTATPHTTMRKVIARRLTEAKQQVPHFYLSIDCDIDALLGLRQQLNDRSPEGQGAYKLSVNDFVLKACAVALRRFPACNTAWTDEAILTFADVDVCVAVATPQGLITPIVRRADQKGLAALSNEVKALAAKARDGKLMPEEYQGGTFTLSNLGMFGISAFSAIINPPQSCLLAVAAGVQKPVVKNGAVAIATMMTCTLSIDHRAVDGAVGAEFLQILKGLIEDPLTLML